jgi:hypothetical protein
VVIAAVIVGSPTARRLIFAAAETYACISAGETPSTLAMLSKPSLESSPGNSVPGSIGRSRRSRMAFAYSARFRRCSPVAPGLGAASAARSMVSAAAVATPSSAARSGRGAPLGGIMPVRTLRTTFSHVSGSRAASVTRRPSSVRPPACVRAL